MDAAAAPGHARTGRGVSSWTRVLSLGLLASTVGDSAGHQPPHQGLGHRGELLSVSPRPWSCLALAVDMNLRRRQKVRARVSWPPASNQAEVHPLRFLEKVKAGTRKKVRRGEMPGREEGVPEEPQPRPRGVDMPFGLWTPSLCGPSSPWPGACASCVGGDGNTLLHLRRKSRLRAPGGAESGPVGVVVCGPLHGSGVRGH